MKQAKEQEEIGKNYLFADFNSKKIPFSELFFGKDDLILIHNMGVSCPYCTMWADGLNGVLQHLENRAAFVVVSPDEPKIQKKFYESRGWKFRMYSAKDTSFTADMGFEAKDQEQIPGVSSFRKEGGKIFRVSKARFGPGDKFCIVWHLFALLKDGSNNWEPKFKY